MATLVNVAKMPPAGVKPPYAQDWNAAARDPGFPREHISNMLCA